MLFNSLQFLIFFIVITLLYYNIKSQKTRVWLLLLASCFFYMAFVPRYILILGFTIIIDYFAGLQIARSQGKARKNWLVISLIANVGILVFYKYFNFLLDNLGPVVQLIFPKTNIPHLDILLPIGLSFHTFQAMSYTIEVYRGKQQPEKNFVVYALYVMYYPQLVAGPIERPQNVLHQFHEFKEYKWDNIKEGLSRMMWGFFKKVVIADRLAMVVDHTFKHHTELSGWSLFIGALFYSFQIYCDFSGYSDIGIGAAKVMGVNLMENFNQPYLSRNISAFWGRWHISLSTWFRDYLYIPLGGNRKGELRRKMNAMIVFMASGLWHGANWTFVLWGALHGALVTFFPGRSDKELKNKNFLRTTFFVIINLVVVTLCWVFFRSPTVAVAFQYISAIFTMQAGIVEYGLNIMEVGFSVLLIGLLLSREYVRPMHFIRNNAAFYSYFFIMMALCYVFGVFEENQFIYFQF